MKKKVKDCSPDELLAYAVKKYNNDRLCVRLFPLLGGYDIMDENHHLIERMRASQVIDLPEEPLYD